jgi:diacylglycerol kinase (ATP)
MNTEKKILFIVNPASGKLTGKPDAKTISRFFAGTSHDVTTVISSYAGHASEIAADAVKQKYDAVIAIGGDGTVNEIARILNGTECALGIIPCGSGNGLARHHKISLLPLKALTVIRNFKTVKHDALNINGMLSFNVSGIGFDAHVAHLFGKNGKRGFNSYLKLVIKEFKNYREQMITIDGGGVSASYTAMLTAISNGSQFGNNARISPHADTNDGLADITVVRKMNGWKMPYFAYKVFRGEVASSPYSNIMQAEKFTITSAQPIPLHIDGEPSGYAERYNVSTIRSSLNLIIP